MLAPEPDFFYKPLTVEEPFTHQPAERRELAPALDELGVDLIRGSLASVSPAEHRVTTTAARPTGLRQARRLRRRADAPGLPRRRDVLEPPHRPAGRRAHPSRSDLVRRHDGLRRPAGDRLVASPLRARPAVPQPQRGAGGGWAAAALRHPGAGRTGRVRDRGQRRRRRALQRPSHLARDQPHAPCRTRMARSTSLLRACPLGRDHLACR